MKGPMPLSPWPGSHGDNLCLCMDRDYHSGPSAWDRNSDVGIEIRNHRAPIGEHQLDRKETGPMQSERLDVLSRRHQTGEQPVPPLEQRAGPVMAVLDEELIPVLRNGHLG